MAPFDRSYTTYYWSAIVGIALSCTISSYLTLNNFMTLKSRLRVTQGHYKWCGIPEEPGSHSSHLVVQIFLQNHGYTFHRKDLEKGQGDSR